MNENTPLTNAKQFEMISDLQSGYHYVVSADFAGQLEQLLSDSQKREAMLRDTIEYALEFIPLSIARDKIVETLSSTTHPPYVHEDRLREVVVKLNLIHCMCDGHRTCDRCSALILLNDLINKK